MPVNPWSDENKQREIKRQHRWKLGQNPNDPDIDDPNWHWFNLEVTETVEDPDMLSRLQGGPECGVPCTTPIGGETCGTLLHICAEMDLRSLWELYQRKGVDIVGDEPDWEHIDKDDTLLVLGCPRCHHIYQWRRKFLPRRV